VHEKVVVDGKIDYLKNPLDHFTYRSTPDFIKRLDEYSTLAAREIKKKSGRAGLFALTVRPVATFIRMYFLRCGFLDGKKGLVLAMLYCCYTFVKYVKTWEKEE
jgi:hypothetical protein